MDQYADHLEIEKEKKVSWLTESGEENDTVILTLHEAKQPAVKEINKRSRKAMEKNTEAAKQALAKKNIYEQQLFVIINGQLMDKTEIDREKTGDPELDQRLEDEFQEAMAQEDMSDAAIAAYRNEQKQNVDAFLQENHLMNAEQIEERFQNSPLDKKLHLKEVKAQFAAAHKMDVYRKFFGEYEKQVKNETLAQQLAYRKGSENYNSFTGRNGAVLDVLKIEELEKITDLKKQQSLLHKAYQKAAAAGNHPFLENKAYEVYYSQLNFALLPVEEWQEKMASTHNPSAAYAEFLRRNTDFFSFVNESYAALKNECKTRKEYSLVKKMSMKDMWTIWAEDGVMDVQGWLNRTEQMTNDAFNEHVLAYDAKRREVLADRHEVYDPSIHGMITPEKVFY